MPRPPDHQPLRPAQRNPQTRVAAQGTQEPISPQEPRQAPPYTYNVSGRGMPVHSPNVHAWRPLSTLSGREGHSGYRKAPGRSASKGITTAARGCSQGRNSTSTERSARQPPRRTHCPRGTGPHGAPHLCQAIPSSRLNLNVAKWGPGRSTPRQIVTRASPTHSTSSCTTCTPSVQPAEECLWQRQNNTIANHGSHPHDYARPFATPLSGAGKGRRKGLQASGS
jgi:hypothetical protein